MLSEIRSIIMEFADETVGKSIIAKCKLNVQVQCLRTVIVTMRNMPANLSNKRLAWQGALMMLARHTINHWYEDMVNKRVQKFPSISVIVSKKRSFFLQRFEV